MTHTNSYRPKRSKFEIYLDYETAIYVLFMAVLWFWSLHFGRSLSALQQRNLLKSPEKNLDPGFLLHQDKAKLVENVYGVSFKRLSWFPRPKVHDHHVRLQDQPHGLLSHGCWSEWPLCSHIDCESPRSTTSNKSKANRVAASQRERDWIAQSCCSGRCFAFDASHRKQKQQINRQFVLEQDVPISETNFHPRFGLEYPAGKHNCSHDRTWSSKAGNNTSVKPLIPGHKTRIGVLCVTHPRPFRRSSGKVLFFDITTRCSKGPKQEIAQNMLTLSKFEFPVHAHQMNLEGRVGPQYPILGSQCCLNLFMWQTFSVSNDSPSVWSRQQHWKRSYRRAIVELSSSVNEGKLQFAGRSCLSEVTWHHKVTCCRDWCVSPKVKISHILHTQNVESSWKQSAQTWVQSQPRAFS